LGAPVGGRAVGGTRGTHAGDLANVGSPKHYRGTVANYRDWVVMSDTTRRPAAAPPPDQMTLVKNGSTVDRVTILRAAAESRCWQPKSSTSIEMDRPRRRNSAATWI
jgi:hypothetical protein